MLSQVSNALSAHIDAGLRHSVVLHWIFLADDRAATVHDRLVVLVNVEFDFSRVQK